MQHYLTPRRINILEFQIPRVSAVTANETKLTRFQLYLANK